MVWHIKKNKTAIIDIIDFIDIIDLFLLTGQIFLSSLQKQIIYV